MSDFALRRLAERYANEEDYKLEVDRALGVTHYPPHRQGQCRLCDEQLNQPMKCPRCSAEYIAREDGCCWKHDKYAETTLGATSLLPEPRDPAWLSGMVHRRRVCHARVGSSVDAGLRVAEGCLGRLCTRGVLPWRYRGVAAPLTAGARPSGASEAVLGGFDSHLGTRGALFGTATV